jgi:hypothetical protein
MSTTYPPPVSQLLELGEAAASRTWMDYLELGLGPEHVSDLIRMATDEQLNDGEVGRPETWAPVHAWRALGQLRAESAVEPLLELAGKLEDDDYAQADLGRVFGMIGVPAVPALSRVLTDAQQSSRVRAAAARGLDQILENDESTRDEVGSVLMAAMGQWEENDEVLNAWVMDVLVEHQFVEAVPLMEKAFAAGRVDLLMRGDWEDVQMDLGLIEDRGEWTGEVRVPLLALPEPFGEGGWSPAPAPSRTRDRDKKAKRKQQKESRKKNRRRK